MFLAYLHQQGYPVFVANTTSEVTGELVGGQKLVYLLIGVNMKMSNLTVRDISSEYDSGQISLLIAEGNTTNSIMLGTLGASVTGHAITDPTSYFVDQRVFTVDMRLPDSSSPTEGVIDIASPITLSSTSPKVHGRWSRLGHPRRAPGP
jgi:hypothetical protein